MTDRVTENRVTEKWFVSGKGMLVVLWLLCAPVAYGALPDDPDDVLIPTGGWLTGPSSLFGGGGQESQGMPCLLTNRFHNGYEVRFSGGGNRLFAMVLDVRESLFVTGNDYDIRLRMAPDRQHDVTAVAHNPAMLVVNLQHLDGAYQALANARHLTVTLSGVDIVFALPGIREGLERVEDCFANGSTHRTSAGQAAKPEPVPSSEPPPSLADMPVQQENRQAAQASPVPFDGAALEINSAALRDLFLDGASQEETDAARQPDPAAVAQQPSQRAIPRIYDDSDIPASQPRRERPDSNGRASEPAIDTGFHGEDPHGGRANYSRWRALRGANARDTLENWAGQENVRVVWRHPQDFPIRDSFIFEGAFDQAVESLLSRYENETQRPTGRLYNDPSFGQRVLVVE